MTKLCHPERGLFAGLMKGNESERLSLPPDLVAGLVQHARRRHVSAHELACQILKQAIQGDRIDSLLGNAKGGRV